MVYSGNNEQQVHIDRYLNKICQRSGTFKKRYTNLYRSIENDEGRCVIYTRKIMDGKYTFIGNNTRRVLKVTKEGA
jgi:hypothetical protein